MEDVNKITYYAQWLADGGSLSVSDAVIEIL